MSSVTVRDEPRGSPFMRIPLELRFAIYEELLAPPSNSERVLCMCDRCQEKKTGRKCANPDKRERAIYPAIMATSKTIHDEAMVILYSKNIFQIICPEISTYPTNKRVPEICGTNSLVTSEGGPRSLYMKQVVVSFSCYARDELDNLPHMWSWVEPMMLAYYPGVQRISINLLRVNAPYRVLITMARKDQYSFKAEMAAQKSQNYWDALKLRQCDSNWEVKDLCDTILPAHRPGLFDDSSFAIRAIQWSDSKKSRNLEKLTRGIFLE